MKLSPNNAPAPNRRPRFPLGTLRLWAAARICRKCAGLKMRLVERPKKNPGRVFRARVLGKRGRSVESAVHSLVWSFIRKLVPSMTTVSE